MSKQSRVRVDKIQWFAKEFNELGLKLVHLLAEQQKSEDPESKRRTHAVLAESNRQRCGPCIQQGAFSPGNNAALQLNPER